MPVARKLAAVVIADVVGYSRLMERDEAGTHARLRELREKLIDPKIAEHGGRTVRTAGDGMLLEFPSATAALRCAVEIQREMGARNLYVPTDSRIEYRIGINLGDIIVEGPDIAGDGVNVAARLETLAEPGGICVAAAIWEQVHEDLGVEFIDSGEQQVKNISKPIRVFRVVLGKGVDAKAAAQTPGLASSRRRFGLSRWVIAATAAVIVLAAAIAALWRALPQTGVAETAAGQPPLHSVMIVPFTAAPGDAALASAAARLTADVTRALGDSMRETRVTPPDVAAAFAGKTGDARAVGRDAKVRFLLEGDVRAAGTQVTVTLRLVDAREARQIQTERRMIDRARLAEDHEFLVGQLTSTSRVMLAGAFSRSIAQSGGTSRSTAQDLVDRADALTLSDPGARAREVRRLADEAIRLEPNNARAWRQRAESDVELFESDFTADRERVLAEADADSLRAVTLDPHDAPAWTVRSMALGHRGYLEAAFAANDRAQELDPTRFSTVMLRGWLYLIAGKPDESLKTVSAVRRALGNLDPGTEILACAAQVALGAYDEAIAACERAAASENDWVMFANLTAAYALRGDTARAAQAKAKLLQLRPEFTIARYEAKRFYKVPEMIERDRSHLIAGLRRAGVPE